MASVKQPWTKQPSPRRAPWWRRSGPVSRYLDDWPELFGEAKRRLEACGPVESWPVPEVPCEVVLTGAPNSNGKVLLVRCRCMAMTTDRRYYNYGELGTATSIPEALALWRTHTAGKHG